MRLVLQISIFAASLSWSSRALACAERFIGSAANDELAFVIASTGERVDLDGVLREFLNQPDVRVGGPRRDSVSSMPLLAVVMNDAAEMLVLNTAVQNAEDPDLLSDLLLENAAFLALRAQHPGETLLLIRMPSPAAKSI